LAKELQVLSLLQGERTREVISANTAIGRLLRPALNYTWTETEKRVLLEEQETFDAELIQEEREEAKREAEKGRPGLVMFTDWSWMESGAAGYVMAWKEGQSWKGIKTHMGYNQEAFDAGCASLARPLESASTRNVISNRIAIFTDLQAAIRRMASDEQGPGQKYVLEARKNITALRMAVLDIVIEIRWCPAHEGLEGNKKADELAKLVAEEPDATRVQGLEWFTYWDRPEERSMPLPR